MADNLRTTASAENDLWQQAPDEIIPDRVLIVDDDESVRYVFSRMLSHAGIAHKVVASGEEALAALEEQSYGCVLADKNLQGHTNHQGIDGIEVVRRARELAPYCSCIVVTGFASVKSTIEALRLGADDYIEKPVSQPELIVERIRAFIRRRRDELAKHQKLAALVVRDPLTGLFNHVHFHRELERALHHARRTRQSVSVLFIDMDGFKQVNDNLGHQVGDDVIVQLAQNISPTLRADDTVARLRSQDLLARYGGDEFAAILYATDKIGAAGTAERLRRAIEGHNFGIPGFARQTISIGVATFPEDAADRQELVRAADTALYACKHAGRNCVITYGEDFSSLGEARTKAMQSSVTRLEGLDRLLNNEVAHFEYQPIVRLDDGSVFGYEALFRPDEPSLPTPLVALDTAARAGRIPDLGRLMRKLAARAIVELPDPMLLFVNIHPYELNDDGLYEPEPFFATCPGRVVLELTGLDGSGDGGRLHEWSERLREKGFGIATDDLGASYGGLATVAALEPSFIKLTMKLLQRVQDNSRSALAFRHFVAFSRDLGVRLVAVGVETEDERQTAIRAGAELAQGFLFGRPGPAFPSIEWHKD